jgi:argininosuccinate lyase
MSDLEEGQASGKPLWAGRFGEGPSDELLAFTVSLPYDRRLGADDLAGSRAHVRMLELVGLLQEEERQVITAALARVEEELSGGTFAFAPTDEDIHTAIERRVTEIAGPTGAKLHTGRSRNDQVATATRLWTIDACDAIDVLIVSLQRAMITQAEKLQRAAMPAYTHLQRAQPVSGAHWMLSHFWPLQRDRERLNIARYNAATLPLGSGAIAGSAFPIDRARLAKSLGFASISQNSIDAVGDRDFIAEVLFTLALVGAHLSRLAEDLILFGSSEFGFVRYGDAFSTGSSMMPQKRNPDALELARGSSARMLGDLVALLATIKGLPSGYNKDLQEDKRTLFDATDGMTLLLPAVAGSLQALTFDTDRMKAAVTSTMMATDLADYLVRKRVTFREAHGAVGQLVREAEEKSVELGALPFASFKSAHSAFDTDVIAELSPAASLGHREIDGGTGPKAVGRQLAAAKATIRANI